MCVVTGVGGGAGVGECCTGQFDVIRLPKVAGAEEKSLAHKERVERRYDRAQDRTEVQNNPVCQLFLARAEPTFSEHFMTSRSIFENR
jgi:hypothetical protein